jgi:transposase
MTTKTAVTAILDKYKVPYVPGRAPKGDSLDQLKDKLSAWLKVNAEAHGLIVGVTRVTQLCKLWGHFPPLFTPPYHPELQPIERLWRDVKQYVSREFAGTRTVTELRQHVIAGFRKYGTVDSCQGRIIKAIEEENVYVKEGVYAEVIDLTLLDDDSDDELELAEDQLDIFDDASDEENDVYDD